jgi:hypothetical protein
MIHSFRLRAWRVGPVTLRPLHVLAAAVTLWAVATSVYADHEAVRVKVLRNPHPPQPVVAVALPDALGFSDPYAVLIYRLRNTGRSPVAIAATLNGEAIAESVLSPGRSSRVDVAVRRAGRFGANSHLTMTGTTANWIVEYVEIANIHGFTRGAVEFLILPAAQPFARAPWWLIAAWAAWSVCLTTLRRPTMPRWIEWVHIAACSAVGLLVATVAIAPLVSAFRFVLAPHAYLGALAVVVAPQLLGVTARLLRWSARHGLALVRAIFDMRERIWRAIIGVPWLRVTLAIAFVLYAAVLWRHVGAYAAGADSSGYLNSARLLSEGVATSQPRAVPGLSFEARNAQQPLGLTILDSGELAPTYPVGVSVMIAGAAAVVGWDAAADVVMVLHALAGLILTFWLARECGFSVTGASIAALMLASTPLYLFMALTLMSDIPSLVWVTAGVLLARRTRQGPQWAFAAGAAVGVAVLVRPTNILALIPIAICIGAMPTRWMWLAAGGAPAALFLGLYNDAVYGAPLTSGYVVDYDRLFDLDYMGLTLRHYVQWLPVLLTPLGVLLLGLPALMPQAPRLVTMLLAWSAAFGGFYAVYFHTHETWWYLRFLLPAFPPFIVGSLWVGYEAAVRLARAFEGRVGWHIGHWPQSVAAALVVAVFVLAHNDHWTRHFSVLDSGRGQQVYVKAADWAELHLPADAVVLAMQTSGTLFYYTDFPVVRWDHVKGEDWRRLRAAAAHGGLAIYAMLFPFEIDDLAALRMHVPGDWVKVGTIEHVTVWRLDP